MCLLNFEECDLEELYQQFINFRAIQLVDVKFLDEAVVSDCQDESKEPIMDTIWNHLHLSKPTVGNNSQFKRLFKVARFVLLTPHFNAGIDRVYSLVNKNKRGGSERTRL